MELEIQTILLPLGATMGLVLGTKPLLMPLVILELDPPLWPRFSLYQYYPTVVVIRRCRCPVSDVFSLLTCLIRLVVLVLLLFLLVLEGT